MTIKFIAGQLGHFRYFVICRKKTCRKEFEIVVQTPATSTFDSRCPACGTRYELDKPAKE